MSKKQKIMAQQSLANLKSGRDFTDVLDSIAMGVKYPNANEITADVTFGAAHYHVPNVVTATSVITLPAVAVGQAWWVICGADGVGITISPNASDLWLYAIDGAASADNKDVILAAGTAKKGDFIRFGFGDSTGHSIFQSAGTWSDE